MKILKGIIVFLFCTTIVFSPDLSYAKNDQSEETIKKQIEELNEQLQETKETKESLQSSLTSTQDEISTTKLTIASIQESIDASEQQIITTQATINRLEQNIRSLNEEIDVLTVSIKKQEVILGNSISFLYEISDVTFLEFFFRSKNLEELFNTHEFIQTIMDENDAIYQEILSDRLSLSQKIAELNLSKLSLTARLADIEKLKNESIQKQNELKTLLTEKEHEELLIYQNLQQESFKEKEASSSIITFIQQLNYLKNLLIDDPEGIDFNSEDFSFESTGILVNPLPQYTISSDFGMRFHPVLQQSRMHNGVDLGGKHGEPIYASGSGIVVFAGPASGYGNWIVIYHGTINDKDIYSIYAHMESNQISVLPKQKVEQNDIIGQIGNAGLSTGPHLHFGIAEGFHNGAFNYVDPKKYIDFSLKLPTDTSKNES